MSTANETNSTEPRRRTDSDENNAPMMAVFGGMFALMLVFLLLVNIFSEAAVRERLKDNVEDGNYRIERENGGAGYVVIVFPESIRIVETGEGVARNDICTSGSPYMRYAERIYRSQNQQLVFFLLDGSIPTMSVARDCLRNMWPDQIIQIGWVIADSEFLKSVMLDDIPSYIREHAQPIPIQ